MATQIEEKGKNRTLNHARTFLRNKQRQSILPPRLGETSVTLRALKCLGRLTQFTLTKDPRMVRRGAFKFDLERERMRIAKAEALIKRVAPGPFEDPNYFALLSYQAASIEMAYELPTIKPAMRDRFSKFLLGTVHDSDVNAFADTATIEGYTIVFLNSGLIDFIYQAAKVTVEALSPVRSRDGRSVVHADFDLDVIKSRLKTYPKPADRLYRTFEAYFFKGYPRASAGEAVPDEQHPVLSLLVSMAERWVIGHEYGHGLAPSLDNLPKGANPAHVGEYAADGFAAVATVLSAAHLDHVPPEFPLGGALFALCCVDILTQAINTLRTGNPVRVDIEHQSHPTPGNRAAMIIDNFRQVFEVSYHKDGLFELDFILRDEVPNAHGFTDEHSKRAYNYANVLWTVWKSVQERLLDDFRRGRHLHPLWH